MSTTDQDGASQSGEDQYERLNRQFIELLQEARMAILGVQLLFVFLLRVPFSERFTSVSTLQEYVFYATLLFTVLSAAFSWLLLPNIACSGASTRGRSGLCWETG
jgi:hypothetical protein